MRKISMEVKETAKSPEYIFGDLICQSLREILDGEIKHLTIEEVQQILVKAKHQAESREMQNTPYTNSPTHQHMVWYHPVNAIHHQFNLQRLNRNNTT